MDRAVENETAYIDALLCQDSEWYKNPFNGLGCSHHNSCVDWINVLDEEELAELLESCPASCNLVPECLNATHATYLTAAVTSYLDEASSSPSTSLSAIAVMSAIGVAGVVLVGFLVLRNRGISNGHSKVPSDSIPDRVSDVENPAVCQSQDSSENDNDGKLHESKRVISVTLSDINMMLESNDLPTPRLLPELNVLTETYSSESCAEECGILASESNVSTDKVIVRSPLNELHSVGSKGDNLSEEENNSTTSPTNSICYVHLLGASISYEYDSDCSTAKNP